MAKILLTSNGFFTESIKQEFLQLIEGNTADSSAAIITTASPKKEQNRFAVKAGEDFLEMGIRHIEFIDIEFDDPSKLEVFDVIYLNGGNPFYLLHHLKRSGADKVLKKLAEENTVIIGVSAGAMVLGPDIRVADYFTPEMNGLQMKDLSGLEITKEIVFPHYDREDLFPCTSGTPIEERLKEYEAKYNCTVLRIAEDQSQVIQTAP